MPSYNGAMTVQQLIDLVAYLKSLDAPNKHRH
jgi:cytochrome c1